MAVVENLTEEEAYLVTILTDASGIDLAEFLMVDDERQDSIFRCWNYQVPWFRDNSPLQIDACVAKGQLVLTTRGHVPIEDVLVGDEVLTHKGRWRRVLSTWDKGIQEVVKVKGQGHPGIFLTPDHPILARKSIRASGPRDGHKGKKLLLSEWLSPAEWEWNDGSGKMHANWGTPVSIASCGLPEQMTPAYQSGQQNYVKDIFSESWMWLYGLFCAEGSTYIDAPGKGLVYRSQWSVHKDEVPIVTAALSKVGLNFSFDITDHCGRIMVNSKPVTLWLKKYSGHLAHGKHLAPWVFGLPEYLRQQIFDGASFGDGYQRKENKERNSYTTVSRKLAIEMRLLGLSLDKSVSVSFGPPRVGLINGRTIHGRHQKYVVESQPLLNQSRPSIQILEGSAWGPVTSITNAGMSRVYDLEVEEDHSFVVEGIAVHNCARAVGKSLSIKLRAMAFPFCHPGQEMLITAPELVHLEPIVGLIERQYYDSRLLREMMPTGRSAVTHRPFQMNILTGSRIIGRIPQSTGRGVKGSHPIALELDEAQDYPAAGWTELIETLKRGSKNSIWRAHGVSRGIRDKFYDYSQPASNWKVHEVPAMVRPNWTDQERIEKIELYGSREDPDFRRNILGKHGNASQNIFVTTRLFRCIDSVETSKYNDDEYHNISIKAEQLVDIAGTNQQEQVLALAQLLDFPAIHKKYTSFWAGADIGFVADPTEILVFAEYLPTALELKNDEANALAVPDNGATRLKLICRIHLMRISHPLQVQVIESVIQFYKPNSFGTDKTGNGLPLFQDIQSRSLENARVMKGYNFSEKVIVDIDGTVYIGENDDLVKEAAIRSNVLERSTDMLRELVDHGRLLLPWDKGLIREFEGQTFSYSKSSIDAYGRNRRIFSSGSFHCLDAARMAAMAHSQYKIETFLEDRKVASNEDVLDYFMAY